MVERLFIRPLEDHEYEEYFRLRFVKAKKHNPFLVNETAVDDKEMDFFDMHSIHIGAFLGREFIGCVRLVIPLDDDKSSDKYLNFKADVPWNQARIREQNAISQFTLPTSTFLKEDALKTLESYFKTIKKMGYRISEIGRLINFARQPQMHRHIPSLIRYVWAINMHLKIDFCFLNASLRHARFYEKRFACEKILPNILLDTGAGFPKCILKANIQHPSPIQSQQINSIRKTFEMKGLCPITI